MKKEVFSNCAEASGLAQELTPDEDAEFISYLGRILAMPSNSSGQLATEAAPLPPGAPNAPVGPLRDLNLWQVFEPTRELEAKRCALDLLQSRTPASVEVVPEMLDLAAEKNASPEYRSMLTDTAWAIAVETAKRDYRVPNEKLRRLLEQVTIDNNGYAENILIELHKSALPYLAAELKTPDLSKRHRIREILLFADPEGLLLAPAVLPLLDSADDGLRIEVAGLLAMLPAAYPQALPALLAKLSDPSAEVLDALYDALDKILPKLNADQFPTLNEQQAKQLLEHFERAGAENREVLEPLIGHAVRQSTAAAQMMRKMIESSDSDLRSRAMRLSAPAAAEDAALYQLFTSALYDDALQVRVGAVQALGSLRVRTAETAASLIRLLKSVSADRDVEARQRLVLEVAKAASELPVDKTVLRMTPYFVDALGFKTSEPSPGDRVVSVEESAAKALVKIGQDAVPPLVKALKSGSPVVRRRALEVLFQIKPLDKKTLRATVDLFKDRDPAVRESLNRELGQLGGEGVLAAKEALAFPELGARTAAARLLLKLGVRDEAVIRALSEGLAGLPCRESCPSAADIVALDPSRRDFVENKLLECFSLDDSTKNCVLDALGKISPLSATALSRIEAELKNEGLPPDARLRVAYRSKDFGLGADRLSPILLGFLQSSDNSVRNRVVSLLAELGPGAESAVEELKKIVANPQEEPLIRNRAIVALTKIKPSEVNYIDLLLDEMRGDRYQWAQSAMSDIPPELLLPLLQRSISELPDDRKQLAVRMAGRMGSAGRSLETQLLGFAQSQDLNLRYAAAVALLRLDPKRPEVIGLIRKQLVGKQRRRLIVEKLPQDALETIQTVAQSPESFVESRAAQDLLAANRGLE